MTPGGQDPSLSQYNPLFECLSSLFSSITDDLQSMHMSVSQLTRGFTIHIIWPEQVKYFLNNNVRGEYDTYFLSQVLHRKHGICSSQIPWIVKLLVNESVKEMKSPKRHSKRGLGWHRKIPTYHFNA